MQRLISFLKILRIKKEILLLISITIIILYPLLLNPYGEIFPFNDVGTYASWKIFLSDNIKNLGTIPLWNPYFFAGAPFLGNSQVGIFYPINIVYLLIPVQNAFSYSFLLDFLLIGIFTYKYVRLIGLRKQSALVAALCMIFNGSVMKQLFLGHIIILDSITWFPLLMCLFEKSLIKKTLYYGVISGIIFGLMVLAGNIQLPLYAIIAASTYYFIRFYQEKKELKNHIYLIFIPLISLAIGILLSAIQLIPTYEFSLLSARSKGISFEFASAYSFNPKQLAVIIFPSLFGSDMNNTYWGIGSFWSSSIYSGIIPFFLAFIGLIYKRNKYTYSLFIILLFALIYSFGKYTSLFKLFFDYFPFFNNFRVPTRSLFIYAFSFSIFAGFGFEYLLEHIKNNIFLSKIIKFLSLILLVSSLLYLFGYINKNNLMLFDTFILKNSYAQGINHQTLYFLALNDLLIFCLLIFIFLILLILFYFKKLALNLFLILIFLLISIDFLNFYYKFYKTNKLYKIYNFENEFSYIKKDHEKFRIFLFPGGNEYLSSNEKIETLTGFDPLYLSSYRDLLWETGLHENTPYESFIIINKIDNLNILKALNVKYIFSKNQLDINGISEVFKDKYYIYRVNNYFKRAYAIYSSSPNFNYKNINLEEAKIEKYEPNKIIINLEMKNNGYLILSENYYPGWIALDNGKKINILKSNNNFRAVFLKRGVHKVDFFYNPSSYRIGKLITIFVICLIIIYFLLYNKKRLGFFKIYFK